ncbi:5-hydroxytryptamine receptor 3A-like [Mantella aurantiaca]
MTPVHYCVPSRTSYIWLKRLLNLIDERVSSDYSEEKLKVPVMGQEANKKKNINLKKSAVVKLAGDLMAGYNKAVRPVLNWRSLTTVNLDVTLYAILGVSWVDEFLTWNPMDYDNVTKISLPTQMIWVPDISVVESVNEEKPREISYAYIHYNGRVLYSKPEQIVSTCNLKIFYFPFDHQNCSLTFSSWTHTIMDIDIASWNDSSKTFFTNYRSDGEWELKNVIPQHIEFKESDVSFGEIIIKRKPLYYVVNLIFPSLLLVIMDIVGFYLPPEGGERISFKITLLLGYSVFLIIVAEELPAAGLPLIGVYFALCMVMLVVSLMESILIVRIIHKENLHPEIPKWLKKFTMEIVAPLVCLKKWVQFTTSRENSSTSTKQTGESTEKLTSSSNVNILGDTRQLPEGQDFDLLVNILKEVGSIRDHLKNSDQEMDTQEWLRVGYLIDKLLFRAYLVFFLVCSLSIGGIWLHGSLASI